MLLLSQTMLPVGGAVSGDCVYCLIRFFGQQSLISVGLSCQDSTPLTHMFSVSNRCLISQAGRRGVRVPSPAPFFNNLGNPTDSSLFRVPTKADFANVKGSGRRL